MKKTFSRLLLSPFTLIGYLLVGLAFIHAQIEIWRIDAPSWKEIRLWLIPRWPVVSIALLKGVIVVAQLINVFSGRIENTTISLMCSGLFFPCIESALLFSGYARSEEGLKLRRKKMRGLAIVLGITVCFYLCMFPVFLHLKTLAHETLNTRADTRSAVIFFTGLSLIALWCLFRRKISPIALGCLLGLLPISVWIPIASDMATRGAHGFSFIAFPCGYLIVFLKLRSLRDARVAGETTESISFRSILRFIREQPQKAGVIIGESCFLCAWTWLACNWLAASF